MVSDFSVLQKTGLVKILVQQSDSSSIAIKQLIEDTMPTLRLRAAMLHHGVLLILFRSYQPGMADT